VHVDRPNRVYIPKTEMLGDARWACTCTRLAAVVQLRWRDLGPANEDTVVPLYRREKANLPLDLPRFSHSTVSLSI
jgi:hypothetical protein